MRFFMLSFDKENYDLHKGTGREAMSLHIFQGCDIMGLWKMLYTKHMGLLE